MVKPLVSKTLLDVIDWRGDDYDSIVKRGTLITNFKDTLRLLDEHVQRMGLGLIFSMWIQVSSDGWDISLLQIIFVMLAMTIPTCLL